FLRKQEPISTGVYVGLSRRTSARNLDVGGYGSRIALRLSGTTVGVALFRRHCERQRSKSTFQHRESQNGSRFACPGRQHHVSNMITLRTVLPAFLAAKPSFISDNFSFAEIQSSRCNRPRM